MVEWMNYNCFCKISFTYLLLVVALLFTTAEEKTENLVNILLRDGKKATFSVPAGCGLYDQSLFCTSVSVCNQHCSQKCTYISSFELRNLNLLTTDKNAIQEWDYNRRMKNNVYINYYNIEMKGKKPALCGDYSQIEMPIYSIPEIQSISQQFVHKLYFQNRRDIYTHSECNGKCIFGCRQVGYDAVIMSELLNRNLANLFVYQCDSIHAWVFFVVVIIVFTILLIIIASFVRSKMASVHERRKNLKLTSDQSA